jgi:hypothetical protein
MKDFIGQRIKRIREFTEQELEAEGWDINHHTTGAVIELENGTRIYASSDDEGNSPGTLFGINSKGYQVYLFPLEKKGGD